MLKVSCNVLSDQSQAITQCGFMGRGPILTRGHRRNAVVLGSGSGSSYKGPIMAVVSDRVIGSGSGSVSGTLADRLRLGSLTEDGLSYKERFIVRCYEVGINKTATVETIANLLQVLSKFPHCVFVLFKEFYFELIQFWVFVNGFIGGICGFWVSLTCICNLF